MGQPSKRASNEGIDDEAAADNLVSEVPAQLLPRSDIDLATAEEMRQLILDVDHSEARGLPGLELDKNVDVARSVEGVSERRAEERKLADVVPAAKVLDRLAR